MDKEIIRVRYDLCHTIMNEYIGTPGDEAGETEEIILENGRVITLTHKK